MTRRRSVLSLPQHALTAALSAGLFAVLAAALTTGSGYAAVPATMRLAPVTLAADTTPNTTMGAGWIMNQPQYARLQAAGYTGPPPQYLVCDNGGGEDADPCTSPVTPAAVRKAMAAEQATGLVPSYEDYYKLKTALAAGLRGTFLFDIEGWTYTPAWQAAHESTVLRWAAVAARKYGARMIAAPVTKTSLQQATEVDAAKDGVYAVELQDQYATSQPKRYGTTVLAAVTAIRKVSVHVRIIAGIASDPDGWPVTASQMFWSWGRVHTHVDGFWDNAAEWLTHGNGTPTTGCAPAGCITVNAAFLQKIGGA